MRTWGVKRLTDRMRDFPSHYFLETRESPTQSWQFSSRDNDLDVMKVRFEYHAERLTKPGQSVKLTDAAGNVILEKTNP